MTEKPEPNPFSTRDCDGLLPEMEEVGTRWKHSGNNHIYIVVDVLWRGTSDTWEYVLKREDSLMKYSRSVKDFYSDRQGVARFTPVSAFEDLAKPNKARLAHHFTAQNNTMPETQTKKSHVPDYTEMLAEVANHKSINEEDGTTRHNIGGVEIFIAPNTTKWGTYDVRLANPTYTEKDKKDLDIVMHRLNGATNVNYPTKAE